MDETKKISKAFSRIGIGYGAFILVSVILQIAFGFFAAILLRFGVDVSYGNWYMILMSLANYTVGGGVAFLIIKDMPVIPARTEKKDGAGMLFGAFLVCMSALFFGNLIGQGFMSIVSMFQGKPMINPVEEALSQLSTWAIVVVMVVMAPICEEILFRKILIDRIRIYGDKAAILISGFVFGLIHGNFYQFFYAFGVGMVFAYVYISTGKLGYTIVFHMIINFLGSVAALCIQDSLWLAAGYSAFILISVIAGTALLFSIRKELVFEPGVVEVWGKGSAKKMYLNAGMILFFIISAATFLVSEIF